ncbi:hypothetical protein DBR11_00645 [Pedobacter sp. HMWF019]|uniref:hypothetical protein n=1 Tax=Pedobacter sp. HMWF019 TaxID=2056856 RepID=UPI000D3C2954|nr:hypothetical protein [Pedobacter sp. HMWF019]PTT04058.1 hypothetical protein DBR11_00645 [Pedobacter sp. HMWF019]
MKKTLFTFVFALGFIYSYGQNTLPSTGNVGIGTTNPIVSLQVNGTAIIANNGGSNYNENIRLPSANDGYACIALGAVPGIAGTGIGQWSLIKFPEYEASKFTIRHNQTDYFSILTDGKVGIGILNPTEKLAVNGNIRAKELKIEAANWPDYVFEKDYSLPSLEQIEKHIQEKGHLPGIPSAAEVKTEGIEVGDMNAKLLKKIEELTLYLIQQNKKMSALEKDNIELKKAVFRSQDKPQ